MCIVFLVIDQHPDFPLIIAANRDEYHDRPSASMEYWKDRPDILSGRDLREGGAWLGLTRSGYFCTVTNHADHSKSNQNHQSRGQLVRRFLMNEQSYAQSHRHLSEQGHVYRPFNLIFGHFTELYAYSNKDQALKRLEKGYHSVSNGPMNQVWPKMSYGVRKLANLIDQGKQINSELLTALMRDQTTPCENSCEDHFALDSTPIFIKGNQYGTRTTTCLLFDKHQVRVSESCYGPSGEMFANRQFILEMAHAS